MTKDGKTVIFKGDTCRIYSNNLLVTSATVNNDLYRIDSQPYSKGNKAFIVKKDFKLWHRRMGHICDKNLREVKNTSIGIVFDKENNEPCVVCVKGKQTRKPIREDGTRAKKLLELVHSDVVGPLDVNSFSGARFLVTFVDDYSRKLFVYPLKRKSEVFDTFVKFKKMVENQCSTKIKILRTDNGGEYVNSKFKSFFEGLWCDSPKNLPIFSRAKWHR